MSNEKKGLEGSVLLISRISRIKELLSEAKQKY